MNFRGWGPEGGAILGFYLRVHVIWDVLKSTVVKAVEVVFLEGGAKAGF